MDLSELENTIESLQQEVEYLKLCLGRNKQVIIYICTFQAQVDEPVSYMYSVHCPGKDKPIQGGGSSNKDVQIVTLLALSMALDALRIISVPERTTIIRMQDPRLIKYLQNHINLDELDDKKLVEKIYGVKERLSLLGQFQLEQPHIFDPMLDDCHHILTNP